MLEIVKTEAHKHSDRLSAISVDRLADVKSDFDKLGVDTSPYYSFEPPTDLGFTVRSVLVVASPSPPSFVTFDTYNGKKEILIPPTYIDCYKQESLVKEYLTSVLQESGFHIAPVYSLPCKNIAAHSGLGEYGRNNVTYVGGMGSFHRLFLFFSDVSCDYECFNPLGWMKCCDNCGKCIENCPTGALTYESNLVNSDRCITQLNEGAEDFPNWLNLELHNALIGCTKCQYGCPQNNKYINSQKEIAHFDKDQTKTVINGEISDEMLKQLGITYSSEVITRNLKVLLNQIEK